MYNPTRRNRNIGTAKQGHGANNKQVIPFVNRKRFFENLDHIEPEFVQKGDQKVTLLTQALRKGYAYPCTHQEIIDLLVQKQIDFSLIDFIVLRQPTVKEEALSPVWGRAVFDFNYRGRVGSAIVIEAYQTGGKLKWPKKLSFQEQLEFKRLQEDGHTFAGDGRHWTAVLDIDAVRSTVLGWTVLHEVGHLHHFQSFIDTYPGPLGQAKKAYWAVSHNEREKEADRFVQQVL
jgi:hypothetical protein